MYLLLATLRMLSNSFTNVTLIRCLSDPRSQMVPSVSVSPRSQLHYRLHIFLPSNVLVRSAAARLTFNATAHGQKPL